MPGRTHNAWQPALRPVADNGCFWVLNVGLVALTDVEVRVRDRGQTTVLRPLSADELEPVGQLVLDVSGHVVTAPTVHLEARWTDRGRDHLLEVDLPADGERRSSGDRRIGSPATAGSLVVG